jgi:hypothetical protein
MRWRMTLCCSLKRVSLCRVAREDRLPLAHRHARDAPAQHDLLIGAAAALGHRHRLELVRVSLPEEDRGAVRLQHVVREAHRELEELLEGTVREERLPDAVHRLEEVSDALGGESRREGACVEAAATRDLVDGERLHVDGRGDVRDAREPGAVRRRRIPDAREAEMDAPELQLVPGIELARPLDPPGPDLRPILATEVMDPPVTVAEEDLGVVPGDRGVAQHHLVPGRAAEAAGRRGVEANGLGLGARATDLNLIVFVAHGALVSSVPRRDATWIEGGA